MGGIHCSARLAKQSVHDGEESATFQKCSQLLALISNRRTKQFGLLEFEDISYVTITW